MLWNESTCILRTERDDHARARFTYPRKRPHFPEIPLYLLFIQSDKRTSSLLHNHPSGDPTPSRADIDMTKTIVDTAKPLGITVHDHIIIGKKSHVSFKGLQLI